MRPLESVVAVSFLRLLGRGSSSLLEGGEGMSSGAGVVLAEERLEEDGEGNDRTWNPGGGEGERSSTESSESLSDRSVNGELDPASNM